MTAPNHITGGLVFTGIFCSLFNLNIFGNPIFLTLTIFGSIVPDIDHTKSFIGKLFYPLAKYISKHFGHRTITHSIWFLIFIVIIFFSIDKLFFSNYDLTLIIFFSVFSHLLFDMMTMQGIPLFYPFYKNPCVLPANPELRIRTGNIKQEGIILVIFAFLTIFLQDLFSQGFWSNLNNQFQDVTHTIKEFNSSNNLLKINYDFNNYQENKKGSGKLIHAEIKDLYILDSLGLTIITDDKSGMIINNLTTEKTNETLKIQNLDFINITIDSLNKIFSNKFVFNSKIYSNQKITATTKQGLKLSDNFSLKNEYNINFNQSFKDSLSYDFGEKINEIDIKIEREKMKVKISKNKFTLLQKQKNNLIKSLSLETDNYNINELKNEIIKVKSQIENYQKVESLILFDLINLKEDLISKQKKNKILIFGTINFY